MGDEQKQENLNNQNIQEQEPKQMISYADNEDMKNRAARFGTGGFAAIIYAVVTTICLYKNTYGIMTVIMSAHTHHRARRTITARIRLRTRTQ